MVITDSDEDDVSNILFACMVGYQGGLMLMDSWHPVTESLGGGGLSPPPQQPLSPVSDLVLG